jgi:pilus assembly protein CpaC
MWELPGRVRLPGVVLAVLAAAWAAEPLGAQPPPAEGGRVPAAVVSPAGALAAGVQAGTVEPASPPATEVPLLYRVQALHDRLEMTVNSSRILTLDQKIPQAQVNNPDVLDLVPLSPNQVQVAAKKAGVTQVNLWGADKRVYTVDVVVLGDARQLVEILRTQFPNTAISVQPIGTDVILKGQIDQQEAVSKIIRIAEAVYGKDKVINNMTVSGVQQVLLHVKFMMVSRTKLRSFGFDFAKVTNGNVLASGASSLIGTSLAGGVPSISISPQPAISAYVFHNNSAFFGVLEALRQDGLSKTLAEPNLVAISGRPAYFTSGGEFGYTTSNINGTTVGWKEYGTRLDFVPIVLGGGRIRLEVRPRVSQRDDADGVQGIPALKVNEVETGVELRAGQTLAIAGLVQQQVDATSSGIPWLSEIPYLGALFGTKQHKLNEIELLVMVTPEFVDAMDASQVPPCGPGLNTTNPSDCELFFKGHLEVPCCCPGGGGTNGAGCAMAVGQTAGPTGPGTPTGPGNPTTAGNPAGPGTPAAQAGSTPTPAAPQGPDNTYVPSRPQIPVARPAAPAADAGPAGCPAEPPFLGPTGSDVVE